MAAKRNALGKGLTALLQDSNTDVTGKEHIALNSVSEIKLKEIEANPFQPRENFEESGLEELVNSIKIHGVIQPVTVRKIGYGKFQIISGERRTRAAIRAGLESIPAYVRVANDQEMVEMALIENIHREDLNAIEISLSYKRLLDECKLKQDEVALRVGKKRATVTNYLRLLKLPDTIQAALRDAKISMGHARALINVEDTNMQKNFYNQIIEKELSVRQTEELVKNKFDNADSTKDIPVKDKQLNELQDDYNVIAKKLASVYNSLVKIRAKKDGKGEIIIPFNSVEDLEKILDLHIK